MTRKFQSLLALLLFPLLLGWSQPQTTSSDGDAHIDALIKKLTLEEKIDLIGGVDDFYIRANDKIGLPRLKMADGPVGVPNYGPSTGFAGMGLAATGDPRLACGAGGALG